jgi:hypothetical protein
MALEKYPDNFSNFAIKETLTGLGTNESPSR